MKKLIILLFLFSISISLFGIDTEEETDYSELFSYDENTIEDELSELNRIETFVLNNDYNSADVLSEQTDIPLFIDECNRFDDNFPSFCCGCCLGPIGVVLVMIAAEDNFEEVGEAILGCIVPSTIIVALVLFKDLWWWYQW